MQISRNWLFIFNDCDPDAPAKLIPSTIYISWDYDETLFRCSGFLQYNSCRLPPLDVPGIVWIKTTAQFGASAYCYKQYVHGKLKYGYRSTVMRPTPDVDLDPEMLAIVQKKREWFAERNKDTPPPVAAVDKVAIKAEAAKKRMSEFLNSVPAKRYRPILPKPPIINDSI